ncbi:MAG: DUF1571 domain-containing protein [Gemmataceae bacterium]|nr:DUF1571 domain-containing protein [Gemmataceae bacterium]
MKQQLPTNVRLVLACLAAIVGAAGGFGQTPLASVPQTPLTNPPAPGAAAAPQPVSPLDQPIAWLQEAKRNYGAVQDYTCTMISRENIRGRLKDENVVQMKFRVTPFSVYLRWLSPPEVRNQEVVYVHGRNNNQMRVHAKGLIKGAVGFVSIDVNDPRVLEHSRHTILEAGIGNLIDQTLAHFLLERQINRTEVRIAEYDYDKRRCLRIENTRSERHPRFYAYRSVIYLDKESKLPIRNENYDWPRPGGPAGGELLESFSYVNLQFNVGLTDRDFNK